MANALVLAGAPNTGPLEECQDVTNEALIKVASKPMIAWVMEALAAADGIAEIVIVGPEGELSPHVQEGVRYVEPRESLIANLRTGLDQLSLEDRVLIVTSDIQMITGEIIDRFLSTCEELEADFYYPIIEKARTEERYPGAERTWVPLKGVTVTGGNLLLLEPDRVMQSLDLAEKFIGARKSPLRLASLLGPIFIVKFALRLLTVEEAERKMSALAGAQGRAVLTPDPEIGFDVDKPQDLELIDSIMTKKSPGHKPVQ
jgi:GTP:adenosylcobinamide-phosphate guanylyltransferase